MFTGFEEQGDGPAIRFGQVRVDLGFEIAGEFGPAVLGTNPWPTGILVALIGTGTVQILTSLDNP